MVETLLIPQLDAAEIEHAILHRGCPALTLTGMRALIQRGDDAERKMKSGAAITDSGACHERYAVAETGGRGGAACALRDILVDLAIFIRSRTEALDRGHDHLGIDALD